MGGVKTIAVVGLAVLVVAMSVAVYAATCAATKTPAATNVVQAERFELVDAEGNVRAVLGLQTRSARSVTIADAEARYVVPQGSPATGGERTELPYLMLTDDAGRTRIEVTFDWEGEPVIRLTDEDGRATCVAPPTYGVEMLER